MFRTSQRPEGTVQIRSMIFVPSEYEVDVKRPGGLRVKNEHGFFMNVFADSQYRRMKDTITVKIYRTSGVAYAPFSRFGEEKLLIYMESQFSG